MEIWKYLFVCGGMTLILGQGETYEEVLFWVLFVCFNAQDVNANQVLRRGVLIHKSFAVAIKSSVMQQKGL